LILNLRLLNKFMKKNVKLPSNRNFGLVFFIFFLIISFWPLLDGNKIRYLPLIVSIIFLILAIFNSKLLNPLNLIWIKFGILLGKFISPIVMSLIFFAVVTPIGIIMRIFGKDLLRLKKNDNVSYWQKKDNSMNDMRKQF